MSSAYDQKRGYLEPSRTHAPYSPITGALYNIVSTLESGYLEKCGNAGNCSRQRMGRVQL